MIRRAVKRSRGHDVMAGRELHKRMAESVDEAGLQENVAECFQAIELRGRMLAGEIVHREAARLEHFAFGVPGVAQNRSPTMILLVECQESAEDYSFENAGGVTFQLD
jgi:hypothetical protein